MKKTIRLTESDLHRIIKEGVRKILKEESESYDWDGLDDDRKEFEKHLSWRNKEEVDANDKAITNPLSYMNDQDYDRVGQMIQANRTSKPGAKMSWDWGYKSGRGVDDPTDVKTFSDFEKADDEFINPYDSENWHNYALRDEFWDGIPESRLHRIIKESVRRILKEDNGPLGWNYGGGYQVCIFPTRNGGMKASVIEIGSPVREDALQVCYTGTLEDCEARAEKWNAKNYWNK